MIIGAKFFDMMPDPSGMGQMGMMAAMQAGPMKDMDIMQLPIIPFPMISPCLGLKVDEPMVEILDGYARVSYDFSVNKAISGCLFDEIDVFIPSEGPRGNRGKRPPSRGPKTPEQEARERERQAKMPSFMKKGMKGVKALKKGYEGLNQMADTMGIKEMAKQQINA
jgi:hypothetical protein